MSYENFMWHLSASKPYVLVFGMIALAVIVYMLSTPEKPADPPPPAPAPEPEPPKPEPAPEPKPEPAPEPPPPPPEPKPCPFCTNPHWIMGFYKDMPDADRISANYCPSCGRKLPPPNTN